MFAKRSRFIPVQPFRTAVRLIFIIMVLWLSGCGGGSAGSSGSTNQSPVAVDDSAQTNQDTAVTVNVIANDSDPDGTVQANSITIVSVPGNGGVSANPDGTVTYTPNLGFTGPADSFTYTESDNQGAVSNVATVTVALNARPVAVDDSAQTNQETVVIINVVANDNDPDGTVQTNSVTIFSAPGNGGASANPDGTVTYTPDLGFTGPTDSFTYAVFDDLGAVSNVATVTVALNARPVAVDDSAQTNQETAVNINVIANDSDPDGTVQANSVTIFSAPVNGAASANSDGTVTYTPNLGFAGPTDSFTYAVFDNQGAVSNVATVTVALNARPVAADDTVQTNQDTVVNINVIGNDSDPDGAVQANSVTIVSVPANGGVSANPDGTVTYTPNLGFTGPTDSFTYTVSDNLGAASNVATVTVVVNARPVAADDNAQTNQDTAVNINVVGNDSDLDGTVQVDSVTVLMVPANGVANANPDGTVTYTPNLGFAGPTDSFTYTVSDDQGAISNVATVTVAINLVPQAANFCGATPQETLITGTLPGSDPDNSPGGLMFSLNADGSGGVGPVLTVQGQVVITGATTGDFTYTPNAHPSRRGSDTFAYRVEDTVGGSDSGVVTIIIDPRVMTLGDSVTQGIIDNFTPSLANRVGYREPLYNGLVSNGFSTDFVGSRVIGGSVPGFDPDTESYAGAKDEEIAFGGTDGEPPGSHIIFPGVFSMLDNNPADVVLLHIGTNDIAQAPGDTSPNDVRSILLEIDRWEKSANGNPVAVILARIIDQCVNYPTDCGSGEPAVVAFNNNVAAMASTLDASTGPDEIIIVDQRTELLNTTTNLPDLPLYGNRLHPNTSGYNLMANAWLNSLTDVAAGPVIMEKCP